MLIARHVAVVYPSLRGRSECILHHLFVVEALGTGMLPIPHPDLDLEGSRIGRKGNPGPLIIRNPSSLFYHQITGRWSSQQELIEYLIILGISRNGSPVYGGSRWLWAGSIWSQAIHYRRQIRCCCRGYRRGCCWHSCAAGFDFLCLRNRIRLLRIWPLIE